MIADIIQNKIPTFFKQEIDSLKLEDLSVFFCRKDGIPLYNYQNKQMNLDTTSICALFCGAWQAVDAMTCYFSNDSSNLKDEMHRFSFDTSSSGVYLLPVKFEKETFILGILYNEVTNPGLLKDRIRRLKNALTNFLIENIKTYDSKINNGSEYLFREITDEEIDKLFIIKGN